MTKKIIAIVTTLTCAVWLVGPGVANALTADELQAQIVALTAQLAALQAQLGTVSGTTTPATAFDTNLYFGLKNAKVKALQEFLISKGYLAAGLNTSYFGNLTKAAVVAYQTAKGITPNVGYFGPITRAAANADLGTTPTTPTTPTAAGTLSVALAADTPVSATIISDGAGTTTGSQALIDTLKLQFTTAAGTTAKVKTLVLKRLGVSADSDMDNVYLYDGTTKLAEMNSVSLGVITFNNADGLFTVSGTKAITVKFDLNKDTTAGKTIGFRGNRRNKYHN